MKAKIKSAHQFPPLPLPQGERIEVRGFERAGVKAANPHRTLSLEKGEATTGRNASKQPLEPCTE